MALNFPSSPTNGQQYTDANAVVWEFDGVKWNVITGTANKMFSGCKISLSANVNLTANSTAITFNAEEYDTDSYFTVSAPKRITFNKDAFYRVNLSVYTGVSGASHVITLKKNGSTTLANTVIAPNQYTNYDQILQLSENDYIELYASDSAATGYLTTGTNIEMTRLGLAQGTNIASADAFSGVRTLISGAYNTTSTPTAITWNSTEFNQNANPAGDFYWTVSSPTRITIGLTGYYRIKGEIFAGPTEGLTVNVRKNGTTSIANTNIPSNGYGELDDIYQLNQNDYIQLLVNDSTSTGTITANTYLEVVRLGV
jgi:hypothetical protein